MLGTSWKHRKVVQAGERPALNQILTSANFTLKLSPGSSVEYLKQMLLPQGRIADPQPTPNVKTIFKGAMQRTKLC